VGSLKAAILAARPALIVPCDDGVVWQLHALHSECAELRPLIERSLGSEDAYWQIRSRAAFLKAAAALDIRVPATQEVGSERDLEEWWRDEPAVLKRDGTSGGNGVAIVHSKSDAAAAFRTLCRPPGAGTAWKRWLINHDPLALWSWRRGQISSVTIQKFIQGRPANTMVACWNGEVLAIVTVEVLTARGATGAATVVRLVRNEEIERAARLLARDLKLNGFHGLDFIIERTTGAAYLIELNPRCTQLGHLRLPGQGDLAGAMSAILWDRPAQAATNCIEGSTVAFFPQAFKLNPRSKYLRCGYHDVPWEEPALLSELLRREWPQRQWLSRIYHHFRVTPQPDEVKF
jgi:predicted ATP-grasp superfamily ATP-dependent carboligase